MTRAALLAIYRRNLRAYEAAGNAEKVEIQRRLIARIEAGEIRKDLK